MVPEIGIEPRPTGIGTQGARVYHGGSYSQPYSQSSEVRKTCRFPGCSEVVRTCSSPPRGNPVQKTVTYSRSDLFDLVWSVPLLKLAKDIGVSDVALSKACRRVGIPLPGRGHWAKSEGNRPKQPRMPKYTGRGSGDVTFTALDPEAFRLSRKAEDAVPRMSVPTRLVDPDVLIASTIRAAEKAKRRNGRIVFGNKRVLSVSVSPAAFDRSMILLDTLIKACRQHGYPWKISTDGKTVIQCGGHDIEVTLHERLSKRELPRTQREKQYWETGNGPFFSPQEYEWVSTNQLTFKVENSVSGGARRSWADGNAVMLESKLHEILAGLPVVAEGIRALEAAREERGRRAAEAAEARRDQARAAEVTRRLRANLTTAVAAWERAERIRVFCMRLESRAKMTSQDALKACTPWLDWARQQADILDPTFGDVTDLVAMSVDLPEWFGHPASHVPPKNDWWGK